MSSNSSHASSTNFEIPIQVETVLSTKEQEPSSTPSQVATSRPEVQGQGQGGGGSFLQEEVDPEAEALELQGTEATGEEANQGICEIEEAHRDRSTSVQDRDSIRSRASTSSRGELGTGGQTEQAPKEWERALDREMEDFRDLERAWSTRSTTIPETVPEVSIGTETLKCGCF